MERFDVSIEGNGPGRHVVTVRGELDLATADRLWAQVEPLIGPDVRIVLDASGMTFLDSSGLRVLLLMHNGAAAGNGSLLLVAPPPAVQRVLDLAGVTGLLETRADVQAALTG